ncbi:MAG: DUF2062 domain-containing protein [Cyanobacteria bacterium P01_C01_bin.69]
MVNPISDADDANQSAAQEPSTCEQSITKPRSYALMERPLSLGKTDAKKKAVSNNFFIRLFDIRYWKRLLRYFYIRFLRMQGSPEAIARGVSAGVFAGAFPFLGFQTLIGIAIAALVRGNKMMAAVSTWISNPLTYFPIFALNFHIGRLLLGYPKKTVTLPASPAGINEWLNLGMTVTSALLLGSLVVGAIAGVVGYYIALLVAHRVRSSKKRH